jgi:Tfp pilus assembly protein PilF
MQEFRTAIARDPHYPAPRILLGASLLAGGDVQGARQQLERAVELDPQQPLAQAELAKIDDALGDRMAAVEHWRLAAKLDARNPEYAYRLGDDYLEVSREVFAKLVKGHPHSARAWQIRGQTYAMSGKFEAARKSFERALAADPSLPGTHLALAEIKLHDGDRAAARDEVTKELAIAPGNRAAIALKQRLETSD